MQRGHSLRAGSHHVQSSYFFLHQKCMNSRLHGFQRKSTYHCSTFQYNQHHAAFFVTGVQQNTSKMHRNALECIRNAPEHITVKKKNRKLWKKKRRKMHWNALINVPEKHFFIIFYNFFLVKYQGQERVEPCRVEGVKGGQRSKQEVNRKGWHVE